MKAFWSGFWRGSKITISLMLELAGFFVIFKLFSICLTYILEAFSAIAFVIAVCLLFAILMGIIDGLWIYYHYKRLIKLYLESKEKGDMIEADYIQKRIDILLNGYWENFVR